MEPDEAGAAPCRLATSRAGQNRTVDHTHDAEARSWVAFADDHSDFPVQNLPQGVFSLNGAARSIATIIGDWILDLHPLTSAEALPLAVHAALRGKTLNDLFARPSTDRMALRHALFALLTSGNLRSMVEPHLYPATDVTLHLPFAIGDYTDFYVGIHHATNMGKLIRPDNPLLPNYKHIGYHGRASSVGYPALLCCVPPARSRRPTPMRLDSCLAVVSITS